MTVADLLPSRLTLRSRGASGASVWARQRLGGAVDWQVRQGGRVQKTLYDEAKKRHIFCFSSLYE